MSLEPPRHCTIRRVDNGWTVCCFQRHGHNDMREHEWVEPSLAAVYQRLHTLFGLALPKPDED